ncbi:MAG: peptidase S1, partial [Hyphomonadaceae bacterium]
MTRLLTFIAAVAAFIGLAAVPASAQDWRLNPNYGSVTLRSGFTPDPYVVNLQSGGNINVSQNISGCLGYITRQPDFRLHWQAANYGLPLIISVASNSDTTLVINGPNTQWYCNDDGGQGLNPSVTFSNPASGQYDI